MYRNFNYLPIIDDKITNFQMIENNNTVTYYIKEFFEKHSNEEVEHDKVVDYVFEHIPKARDPWRAIRKLYQEGWLIQVRKGVYKRIPGYKGHHVLAPFSPEVKEEIFKRVYGEIRKINYTARFVQITTRIILHNFRRLSYFAICN